MIAKEMVMNQAALEDFARWHQQDLLDEAARGRLVATTRDTSERPAHGGGASAWRRQVGWALIELGARLSGGYLDASVDRV
jgi:hypothetical protein